MIGGENSRKRFIDKNIDMLVNYNNFAKTFSNSRNKPILVDCTGIINPKDAKSRGIIFRGIGRGNYI